MALDLAEQLPQAKADAGYADQALTNCLSNAIKFLPPGGRVVVRSSATDFRVRLEVQDNDPRVPLPGRASSPNSRAFPIVPRAARKAPAAASQL